MNTVGIADPHTYNIIFFIVPSQLNVCVKAQSLVTEINHLLKRFKLYNVFVNYDVCHNEVT